MKKSSAKTRSFQKPNFTKVFLIGLYALGFYLAPVLSHSSYTKGAQNQGSGSFYFINVFNENFEFHDY